MSDSERIAFVERHRLDVWYHDSTNPNLPRGWVADLGEPDASLWSEDAEGGSALCVGQSTWRDAVDKAAEMLGLLGGASPEGTRHG